MLGIWLLKFLCWHDSVFFSDEILSEHKDNSGLILLKKAQEIRNLITDGEDFKLYVTTRNKERLQDFQAKFLDADILSKIEYITELPHWFRSLLKYLKRDNLKWLKRYFQANKMIIWWGEIFTDEMRSTWIDLTISALPFFLRKMFLKSEIFLTGWIQAPKSFWSKHIYKFWINNSKTIFLRDFKSFDDILSFTDKRRTTPKLKFLFDLSMSFFSHQEIKKLSKQHEKEDISIVNLNPKWEQYFQTVLDQVKTDLKAGKEVFYFPANILEDSQYFDKLGQHLNDHEKKSFKLLDRDYDRDHFIKIFEKADKAIWTRLHFYILCRYFTIDITPLPYQKKVDKMKAVVDIIMQKTRL